MKKKTRKKIIKLKEQSRRYSIFEGSGWAAMFGFGEYFLKPFAIALNVSTTQFGFLFSIPNLVVSLSQIHAAKLTDWYKKRKKIVMLFVLLQALNWAPLFLLPIFFPHYAFPLLLIFYSLFFFFGNFHHPAWVSWFGDIIPENIRGRFLGQRKHILGLVAFTSIILGGLVLQFTETVLQKVLVGFGIIFVMALIGRLASFFFMGKMYEPRYSPQKRSSFGFLAFLKKLPSTNFGRFVIFLTLFQFGVSLGGPFFALYILRDLGFGYLWFTLLLLIVRVADFYTVAYWGSLIDSFGSRKTLLVSAFSVAFVPLLWSLSPTLAFLVLIQFFTGFAWAGFNLSTLDFIYDTVRKTKRARCSGYLTALNGLALFLGTSLGGIMAPFLPTLSSYLPAFFSTIFVSQLQTLFIISFFFRLLPLFFFASRLKEKRRVTPIKNKQLFFEAIKEPLRNITVGHHHHVPHYIHYNHKRKN